MAGIVMGVGPGIFILAVIWVLCLLICNLLSRSGGMISRLSIVLVFLLALILTLILIFFPRAKETPEPVTEKVGNIQHFHYLSLTKVLQSCQHSG
ncbi:transmembrane protein 218 isoform X3 [Narcine bancroftii]|uniref:transmembrane protein 218 isoform X3 n=1 Tax=Narcine bancroftii TaxID=1343680 RepID=UPI003831E8F7